MPPVRHHHIPGQGISLWRNVLQRWYKPVVAGILQLLAVGLFAQDLDRIGHGKPLHWGGGFSLQGGPYFHGGEGAPRNQPFGWNASGNLSLSLYGLVIPFSFNLGPEARSFSQPFNRYGLSPHYKWAKLHLGYRSMHFNRYTLAGLQFFGAGIELEPKGFRFAAFYGRFNKAVDRDTLAALVPRPAYRRMGYGVKIGVGGRRDHLDLMLFRAEDDTTSIVDPGASLAPKENLALGLSGRFTVAKRLVWEFNAGGSALNEDTRYPVGNSSDLPAIGTGLFSLRVGSKLLFAGNSSLKYTARKWSLGVEVNQVDPGYASLGAYYQQTDVRGITVEPSVRLFKNKVRLRGSIGRQQDNLYGRKLATSVRTIGSATLAVAPSSAYGLDISFTNYGIAQEAGRRALNDTFRVAQVNRSLIVTQRYARTNSARTWVATLTGGMQQLQDLNTFDTYAMAENEVLFGNLYLSRIRTRDKLAINCGLNATRSATVIGEYIMLGPSLGYSLPLAKDRLDHSLGASWNQVLRDGASTGHVMNLNTSFRYRYSAAHRFRITVSALLRTSNLPASTSFTEVRMTGGYVFVFRPKAKTQ